MRLVELVNGALVFTFFEESHQFPVEEKGFHPFRDFSLQDELADLFEEGDGLLVLCHGSDVSGLHPCG